MVNQFRYTPTTIASLKRALSGDRLGTYLAHTNGDEGAAVRLYVWNSAVSAAFYGPLQALEVAVRNAMHRELTTRYGPDWYDQAAAGLDSGTQRKILQVKADLVRCRYPVTSPHLVAGLSFGFWVSLLGAGGKTPSGPKANYEMTIWRPAVYKAFPNAPLNRHTAHHELEQLRLLRNRIAHHEPIFSRALRVDHDRIETVAGWVCRDTHEWIASHSRVPSVLRERTNKLAALWGRLGDAFRDTF